MKVTNALQTIKSTLRMPGDYTTCVWDRTYLAQDKLKGLDIMLGTGGHRC